MQKNNSKTGSAGSNTQRNTEHYFSSNPNSGIIREIKKFEIKAFLLGNELTFESSSGVFSKKEIDKGTLALINATKFIGLSELKNNKILDLGCGYGAVGIALARAHPKANVILADVNPRAVALARKNIKNAGLKNAQAICSNGFDTIPESQEIAEETTGNAKDTAKFDLILLNPPQAAGLETCKKLIEDSCTHLNINGKFLLVARHNKGGSRMMEWVKNCTGNCSVALKSGAFRVYMGLNTG